MNCFGKKIRGRLKKFRFSKISCCLALEKTKENSRQEEYSTSFKSNSLEVLLKRPVQHQAAGQAFLLQLRNITTCLTLILQKITQDLYNPLDRLTKSIVTLTKNNSNNLKSLTVLNKNTNFQFSSTSLSGLFSINASIDEVVQSNASSTSKPRTITTSNLTDFKIEMIRHIRTLKQDVITLRKLFYMAESCEYANNMSLDIFASNDTSQCKFKQAMVRATTFVTFYKLRQIIVDKRKSRKSIQKMVKRQ
ncbi:hypothetical protein ABEB36_009996 [Hypothenemus hampei]|uniref:Uncharacterized protein n=1 Tax=Hypothenemus hampei TaxID=57062 RepID=A0ABD1EI60_HYPHA